MLHDGLKGKPSTNGTWLLLKSKYEISNTTYFKIGSRQENRVRKEN